jgi:cobaltochelatase CobT
MLRDVWARLMGVPPPPASQHGYRAFTTKFDLEVHANQLSNLIGYEEQFQAYVREFDLALGRWRAAADIAAVDSLGPLKASVGARSLRDTVATLLIDHSGSMRGQRAVVATALAEIVAQYWSRLGMTFEILGFTTRTWRGGGSRKLWRRTLSPENPGRLCDLLHIVYRTADDTTPGAPWAIRNLLRWQLLKENVDGEALEWAARRLRGRPETRKILVVLSDGAPVDDATLLENGNSYLSDHLKQVVASIRAAADIRLAAIGLDYDVSEFYSQSIVLSSTAEVPTKLIPFLDGVIADPLPK